MKRLLVIFALIAIFAVAFASLAKTSTNEKKVKKPVKSEKTCTYRSSCMG
ncbi:MAG: hypothetical protein WKF97_20390 [Chitinophagaceae bacterium]